MSIPTSRLSEPNTIDRIFSALLTFARLLARRHRRDPAAPRGARPAHHRDHPHRQRHARPEAIARATRRRRTLGAPAAVRCSVLHLPEQVQVTAASRQQLAAPLSCSPPSRAARHLQHLVQVDDHRAVRLRTKREDPARRRARGSSCGSAPRRPPTPPACISSAFRVDELLDRNQLHARAHRGLDPMARRRPRRRCSLAGPSSTASRSAGGGASAARHAGASVSAGALRSKGLTDSRSPLLEGLQRVLLVGPSRRLPGAPRDRPRRPMPLRPGMCTSRNTTCGASSSNSSTASRPLRLGDHQQLRPQPRQMVRRRSCAAAVRRRRSGLGRHWRPPGQGSAAAHHAARRSPPAQARAGAEEHRQPFAQVGQPGARPAGVLARCRHA